MNISDTTSPSSLHPLALNKTFLRNAATAFGVLGFTVGLYAGLSASPVGQALVTGFLGLVSGGLIGGLAGSRDKSAMPVFVAGILPVLTICICLSSILGTSLGIGLRQGYLIDMLMRNDSDDNSPPILDISEHKDKLSAEQYVKLLLIQTHLDRAGIDRSQNNAMIDSFVRLVTDGKAPRSGLSGDLQPVTDYINHSHSLMIDIRGRHYHFQQGLDFSLPEEFSRRSFKAGEILTEEDVQAINLASDKVSQMASDIVMNINDLVEDGGTSPQKRSVNQARRALFRAQQPDLDLALQAILQVRPQEGKAQRDGDADEVDAKPEYPHLQARLNR